MTTRITEKDLQAVCARINRIFDLPLTPYSKADDGTFSPNANVYLLSFAYGGVSLHQMSGTPGCTGESDVLGCGHVPKRELYEKMHSFIRGINAARGE